ncbi:MAG: hemolysin family protein [Rhodobacteraceae bacterium]|nr:hemolysin family protein [Paracoccaceae bacterium]
MDGTSEGSSRAAQGAPDIGQSFSGGTERKPGLIDRWVRTLAGRPRHHGEVPGDQDDTAAHDGVTAASPFHSSNPPVQDVAVPKAEIVAVPLDISLDRLVDVFKQSGRTRLPVYRGSLDQPCGFIHLKDLALQHGFNGHCSDFALQEDSLRELLFVPGAMRAASLLEQMRKERIHLALIIDEYGGTDGLVTIEDLVEVIFGDIADEHDDQTSNALLTEEGEGNYICHARLPLDELNEKLGNTLQFSESVEDEVDTLGGLIFVLAGRVPVEGEIIRYEPGRLVFEIIEAEPQLVRKIRVRRESASQS